MPAGSNLIAIYTYDNSKRNPANPDPNRTVPWGDQSFDEMLYTAVRYRWAGETSASMNTYDELMNKSRFMGIMDSNMDGKLQKEELIGRMGEKMKSNFFLIDSNHDGAVSQEELDKVFAMMRGMRRGGPAGGGPPAPPPAPASTPSAASPAASH